MKIRSIINKGSKKHNFNSILYRICGRSCCVLFMQLIVMLILYVVGNFEGYLDATQSQILTACSYVGIILFVLGIFGIVESLVVFFTEHKKRCWIYFVLFLLQTLFAGVISAVILLLTFVINGAGL